MLTDRPMDFRASPTLEAPEDPASPFAKSPFARCLGIPSTAIRANDPWRRGLGRTFADPSYGTSDERMTALRHKRTFLKCGP
jgi:hypothetical protein